MVNIDDVAGAYHWFLALLGCFIKDRRGVKGTQGTSVCALKTWCERNTGNQCLCTEDVINTW